MNIDKKTYNKNLAIIIIFSYSLLFLANLFHFHSISLNPDLSFKVSNENYSSHFSSFSELNCPIHNVFSSIHNYFSESPQLNYNLSIEIYSKVDNSDSHIKKESFNVSLLRAPPIL